MKERIPFRLGLPTMLMALPVNLDAEILPTRGSTDPRIRTALYQPDQIYRLQARIGYALELIFEEGERYAGPASGDLDGIIFGAHQNHLILKPSAPTVATNLIIFTDRRTYRFDYTATDGPPDPDKDDIMYAVTFTYPPREGSDTSRDPARIEAVLDAGSPHIPNTDYAYCGHPALKPVRASDDGTQTRIRFGDRRDWPAVFVRNDDGTESLLNFSVVDGDMIIHRVARHFVLRRGRITGCIVNRGYGGGGERLPSGTVSPQVERKTRGVQP